MYSYDQKGSSWAITGLVIAGFGFIVTFVATYNFEYGDSGTGVSIGYLLIGLGLTVSLVSWGIMSIMTLQDIRYSVNRVFRSVDSFERRGRSK